MEYNIEELRERRTLTDAIVANLQKIAESGYNLDELEAMEKHVRNIALGLETIEEDDTDLEEMDKQVGIILSGLETIEEDDTDLDALEEQVKHIVSDLNTINEHEIA